MLYFLLYTQLYKHISPLRVFGYTTSRTAFASLTALFLCIALGPWLINKLRYFQIGQYIREEGPRSHQKKAGTPTMGGVLIIISIVVPTLLWADLSNPYVWIATLTLLAFGWIGFLDDYAKITKQRNLGLSGKRKLLYQFIVGFCFAAALLFMRTWGDFSTAMNFPFIKTFKPSLLMPQLMANPWTYVIGVAPFCIFVALVVVFTSNAVNLTDGLDGLAIGLMVIAAGALTILTYAGGHKDLAQYLQLARNPRTAELTIFCGSMTGASLGFLWYNAHPAEIFMGDVGSLGLGGAMAVVAVLIKQEVLLLFIGGIFIVEAISVILQVGSYKLRHGKRIFKMAPLHHHFEALGLDGVENHRPLLDRRPGAGPLRADDVETQMNLKGTRTLVVGMKKSGLASAALLAREGAVVSATDIKPLDELPGVRELNIPFAQQAPEVFQSAELIVLSPDVPADLAPLDEARRRGVPVIGEVELAAPFLKGRTIGITGSNGKTTTTSLIGHILRESGVTVQVGGNIGVPVTAMIDTLSRRRLERAGTLQLPTRDHRRIPRAHRSRAQRHAKSPRPPPHLRELRRRQGPPFRDPASRRLRRPECG